MGKTLSRELFEILFSNSKQAVAICETNGNIVYLNNKVVEIVQLPENKIHAGVYKTVFELLNIPPEFFHQGSRTNRFKAKKITTFSGDPVICRIRRLRLKKMDLEDRVFLVFEEDQYYSKNFILLNNKIDELTAEMGHRKKLELSLRDSEKHLKQRQVEIEELNRDLEQMVRERTEELEHTQQQLLEAAHKAGMAEMASGSLHNIGNVLNSILVSESEIRTLLDNSIGHKLLKANSLLEENISYLNTQVKDSRLISLFQYYLQLSEVVKQEKEELRENLDRLNSKTNLARDVIMDQQKYARESGYFENISLAAIIEEALEVRRFSLENSGVKIERKLSQEVKVRVQKSKLIHILVNLIKNAEEAMATQKNFERNLIVQTSMNNGGPVISITDSGSGIKSEDLSKIFLHGYTTKESGSGFGLHTCINSMREMGGDIVATSKPEGRGTTFTLKFQSNQQLQTGSLTTA